MRAAARFRQAGCSSSSSPRELGEPPGFISQASSLIRDLGIAQLELLFLALLGRNRGSKLEATPIIKRRKCVDQFLGLHPDEVQVLLAFANGLLALSRQMLSQVRAGPFAQNTRQKLHSSRIGR